MLKKQDERKIFFITAINLCQFLTYILFLATFERSMQRQNKQMIFCTNFNSAK